MMNPKVVDEYKELGNLYSKQGRVDQAIGAYRKYLDTIPSDQDVAKKVGLFLYGKKQYQDAVKYLELAKDKNADDVNFQFALGDCYVNIGNLKRPKRFSRPCACRENPRFPTLKTPETLADAYEKDNNQNQAIEIFVAYSQLPGQKDPDACFKAASLLEKVNVARAKKIYEDNIVSVSSRLPQLFTLGHFVRER